MRARPEQLSAPPRSRRTPDHDHRRHPQDRSARLRGRHARDLWLAALSLGRGHAVAQRLHLWSRWGEPRAPRRRDATRFLQRQSCYAALRHRRPLRHGGLGPGLGRGGRRLGAQHPPCRCANWRPLDRRRSAGASPPPGGPRGAPTSIRMPPFPSAWPAIPSTRPRSIAASSCWCRESSSGSPTGEGAPASLLYLPALARSPGHRPQAREGTHRNDAWPHGAHGGLPRRPSAARAAQRRARIHA